MKGYDIIVQLDDFKPETKRELIIPEYVTFHQLHLAMQELWNFTDKHYYEFSTEDYKIRFINFEKHSMDGIYLPDFNEKDAKTEYVNQIFDMSNKIHYTYDFADSWEFTIELKEKINYEEKYPYLKGFEGDYGPVEDCGGVFRLTSMVEYKENPKMKTDDYTKDLSRKLNKFNLDDKRERLKKRCTFNKVTQKMKKEADEKSFEKMGFNLLINFNEVVPFTFREIQVPSQITFSQLHTIIQILVGLKNKHDYQFIKLEENIYIKDNPNKESDFEELDAEETLIHKYLSKKEMLLYEYDPEDTVYLTITTNDIIEYDKKYPTIISYMGDYNLLDDCGGTFGFQELLQLKDNHQLADEEELELIKRIEEFDEENIQKKLIEKCSF